MSLKLFVVLVILMAVNQLLGTAYGTWKTKFDRRFFAKGFWKVVYLAAGYGAIAIAARYAGDYIPNIEYLSGILLEPIAKYFSKICESLRGLLNDSASDFKEQPDKDKNWSS